MSLDKAIASGKEHRKPYQGGKAYCQSCRNHGGCTWCLSNRTHKYNKKIEAMKAGGKGNLSRRFKIERDCYEDENYLYKKGHVTFQPGLTVLVGCNGCGEDNPR